MTRVSSDAATDQVIESVERMSAKDIKSEDGTRHGIISISKCGRFVRIAVCRHGEQGDMAASVLLDTMEIDGLMEAFSNFYLTGGQHQALILRR